MRSRSPTNDALHWTHVLGFGFSTHRFAFRLGSRRLSAMRLASRHGRHRLAIRPRLTGSVNEALHSTHTSARCGRALRSSRCWVSAWCVPTPGGRALGQLRCPCGSAVAGLAECSQVAVVMSVRSAWPEFVEMVDVDGWDALAVLADRPGSQDTLPCAFPLRVVSGAVGVEAAALALCFALFACVLFASAAAYCAVGAVVDVTDTHSAIHLRKRARRLASGSR